MDIDIQNVQLNARRSLPVRDQQGRPKCFYCDNYGRIKIYCRRLRGNQQVQNVQIQVEDSATFAALSENI
ncbi:hypothetical protein GOP47_0025688 [Adiantum capillus-veneris]|uniref:Uncharacterized protein n=1 Tax=Adiantum capillus-veneris TaxID=13818 RepID=A0A9D4U2J1_ADICA|nr:hypothetical protein GOP47_0025688 [Adiantum capillus-veneris]